MTPNDGPGDADTGPNILQTFPVVSYAKTGLRATTIKGSLRSIPNESYTIQFFSNPKNTRDEGKTFVGHKTVKDTDGVIPFTFKPAKRVKAGLFVTMSGSLDQATPALDCVVSSRNTRRWVFCFDGSAARKD